MLIPFKGPDLDFGFLPVLSESLLWVPQWSLCTSWVLVGHFTKTYVLWQAEADSSFLKDEKHVIENISRARGKALWVLHNHKERESRSHLEPVLLVKEKEKRMKKEVSDNFVSSPLLKPNWFVSESWGLTASLYLLLCLPQVWWNPPQVGSLRSLGQQGAGGVHGWVPHVCFREFDLLLSSRHLDWKRVFGAGASLGLGDPSRVVAISGNTTALPVLSSLAVVGLGFVNRTRTLSRPRGSTEEEIPWSVGLWEFLDQTRFPETGANNNGRPRTAW